MADQPHLTTPYAWKQPAADLPGLARQLRITAAVTDPAHAIRLFLTPDATRAVAHALEVAYDPAKTAPKPAPAPETIFDTAGIDLPRPPVWSQLELSVWLVAFTALGMLVGIAATLSALQP